MFNPDALIVKIGGKKYLDLIGAIDLEKGDNFVSFLLPICPNGLSFSKVFFRAGKGRYIVEFWDQQGVVLIDKIRDVYTRQLPLILESVTGIAK